MASRFHSGPPDDFNDPGADDALFFESLFEEAEREVRSVRQVRSSRSDAVAGKAKPEEQSFRRRASAEPNRASDSVNSASARYSRSRTAAFGSASMGVSRTRSVSGRPAVSPFMPPPVYPKEPPSLMSVMAAERGESVPAFEGTAALMNRASPDREGAIGKAPDGFGDPHSDPECVGRRHRRLMDFGRGRGGEDVRGRACLLQHQGRERTHRLRPFRRRPAGAAPLCDRRQD